MPTELHDLLSRAGGRPDGVVPHKRHPGARNLSPPSHTARRHAINRRRIRQTNRKDPAATDKQITRRQINRRPRHSTVFPDRP